MATIIELQEELKKLGVELTGKETALQLNAMLKKAKKQPAGEKPKDEVQEKKSKSIFYVWLKVKSYFDKEGKLRLEAGFYAFDSLDEYPRLANLPTSGAEIFENQVPSRKIADIARWAGVNPDEHRDDAELLQLLISEPKPIK